jgi:hypothetical protein
LTLPKKHTAFDFRQVSLSGTSSKTKYVIKKKLFSAAGNSMAVSRSYSTNDKKSSKK